jgi:transposase InsO family protein
MTLSASRAPIQALTDSPFFLATGANAHISPERSDFKTLRSISPHPISGVGGSCIYAIGNGTIEITASTGHKFTLDNALFAPASKIRLISVLNLNRSGPYISHFDKSSFWLTNTNGATVLRGSVYENRRLYGLSLSNARTTHEPIASNAALTSKTSSTTGTNNMPTTTLYTSRTPDVETWHRRLGHCDFGAIIDMAQKGTVEGMAINLSSSPPKCNACILGKQTRSPVSIVREGEKASRPLERVFVDLRGPIRPVSSSGRLYSMNLIDDYSGYVWSLPLKSKGEAAFILQKWHRAVENPSGYRLKTLVSDDGELVSNDMAEWCAQFGIDRRRTAPNTSAQNGPAERLHRILLDKARIMLLSCKAPAELWDEFCATSAYLTNLTASSSLQGRTPFELWFDRRPSLSHLREIGCRAFALVQTEKPKIFAQSQPCVLIGYFPHSKAYRLWDSASGRIFNSFHVSFVEHLDEQPANLLPGTMITLAPDSPPSWEIASTTCVPKPGPVSPTCCAPPQIPPVPILSHTQRIVP